MKPTINAVAFVIYDSLRKKVLAVQRPDTDDILPSVWGLPAGSLKIGESFEDAVIRAGKEKIGVEVKIVAFIGESTIDRTEFISHMKEYECNIVSGTPRVPQPIQGITQYQQWKYANPTLLKEAARKESLCSRIYLRSIGMPF